MTREYHGWHIITVKGKKTTKQKQKVYAHNNDELNKKFNIKYNKKSAFFGTTFTNDITREEIPQQQPISSGSWKK